jgi:hypothetical protein
MLVVLRLLPRGFEERTELLVVEVPYLGDDGFAYRFPISVVRPFAAVVVHGGQGHRFERVALGEKVSRDEATRDPMTFPRKYS